MTEWPLPRAPGPQEQPLRRRDLRRRTEEPGEAVGPASPTSPEEPSARILPWPGPGASPGRETEPDAAPGRHRGHGPERVVLASAAALLAAWASTCLVDGVRPELLDRLVVAASAASPFVVVAAIPVVALAVRSRLWVTTAVAALAALGPWSFVLEYAVPGGPGTPAAGVRLSVMLLDADAAAADAPSVVAAVARQPVDVLVVTETTSLLTHQLTTAGLDPRLQARWASLPEGSPRAGLCVYSRYPVSRLDPIVETRWPAVRITLDTGQGSVSMVAGRASPPGQGTTAWRSDLRALGASARPAGPSVLVGTLDATPGQPAFRRLAGVGLQDAAAALGQGVRPTWPSWSPLPLLPLDHVLVGGGVAVRSVGTLAVAGTSHRALVADLVVSAGAGPARGP